MSLERGSVPKVLLNCVCLSQGIKARDMLHKFMEKAIQEKLQRNNPEDHSDALDFIMNSAKEHGKEFSMQELKVRRTSALQLLAPAPLLPAVRTQVPAGKEPALSTLPCPCSLVSLCIRRDPFKRE